MTSREGQRRFGRSARGGTRRDRHGALLFALRAGKAGGGARSSGHGAAAGSPRRSKVHRMKGGDSPQQPCYVNSEGWRSRNYSLARPAAAGSAPRCSATTRTRRLDAGWPWPPARPGTPAPGPLSASPPGAGPWPSPGPAGRGPLREREQSPPPPAGPRPPASPRIRRRPRPRPGSLPRGASLRPSAAPPGPAAAHKRSALPPGPCPRAGRRRAPRAARAAAGGPRGGATRGSRPWAGCGRVAELRDGPAVTKGGRGGLRAPCWAHGTKLPPCLLPRRPHW